MPPDVIAAAQAEIEIVLQRYGPFFTLAEAARRAAIPLPTLSDAVRNGRVRSLRLFGKSYVRLTDAEDYVMRARGAAKRTFREMADELQAIGDDRELPTDYGRNLDRYLYGQDTRA